MKFISHKCRLGSVVLAAILVSGAAWAQPADPSAPADHQEAQTEQSLGPGLRKPSSMVIWGGGAAISLIVIARRFRRRQRSR